MALIFQWAIGIGALLALGIITYNGVVYSASFGNSEQISKSKDWIRSAIFGLMLLIGAYLILNTINPNILKF